MRKPSPSKNYKVLRMISTKIRKLDASEDILYLLVYSFLYKYCSDVLKDYLMSLIQDKEITFDEAFRDTQTREDFKNKAIETFGYYITDSKYFMDDVIADSFSERFFIHGFFKSFAGNVEFEQGSNYEGYFSFIFESVSRAVNFSNFEFEGENHLILKDIIYSISELDVFEEKFPFSRVFDRICRSKQIGIDHDPDYISYLISSIVSSSIESPCDVFAPFLNDASLLINLYSAGGVSWKNTYAKSHDELTYCCSIVKLLMHHFDLDYVFSELGNPFEPFNNYDIRFDVIMSRFPPITYRNLRRFNFTPNYGAVKRSRKSELQNLLADKYDVNPEMFENNEELDSALDNLISKMDLKSPRELQFTGEYESLSQSEYLFLINMINSLKDDGVMVVSLSQSFLVKNSLEKLRKYLTHEKNYIDAIISIPGELLRHSKLEIIVVFKKNKTTDDIVFIDMSKDFKTKNAPYATQRVLRRDVILDEDTLKRVTDVYKNRRTVERFSNVVGNSELKGDEYNLSVSRYVDTFEGEFVDLKDLKHLKEKLNRNIEDLNEKIEKMMRELDIRL